MEHMFRRQGIPPPHAEDRLQHPGHGGPGAARRRRAVDGGSVMARWIAAADRSPYVWGMGDWEVGIADYCSQFLLCATTLLHDVGAYNLARASRLESATHGPQRPRGGHVAMVEQHPVRQHDGQRRQGSTEVGRVVRRVARYSHEWYSNGARMFSVYHRRFWPSSLVVSEYASPAGDTGGTSDPSPARIVITTPSTGATIGSEGYISRDGAMFDVFVTAFIRSSLESGHRIPWGTLVDGHWRPNCSRYFSSDTNHIYTLAGI